MAARARETSIRSYGLFRHSGGSSPNGIMALTGAYASFDAGQGGGPGVPLIFYNDVDVNAGDNWPTNGFVSTGMQLINDSGAPIFFSIDGVTDTFDLRAGENILFDWIRVRQLWFRGTVGGEAYRLVMW